MSTECARVPEPSTRLPRETGVPRGGVQCAPGAHAPRAPGHSEWLSSGLVGLGARGRVARGPGSSQGLLFASSKLLLQSESAQTPRPVGHLRSHPSVHNRWARPCECRRPHCAAQHPGAFCPATLSCPLRPWTAARRASGGKGRGRGCGSKSTGTWVWERLENQRFPHVWETSKAILQTQWGQL